MGMVRMPLAPIFLSSEMTLYTCPESMTAWTAIMSPPAMGTTVGPPIPGIMRSTSGRADLGTSAMMYFLPSAAMTLAMELTISAISSPCASMAASDDRTAAWDSTIVPISARRFILSVDPVETRSTI